MVKGDSFCTLLLYNAQTDDNNGLQFWIEEIQMVRKEFLKVVEGHCLYYIHLDLYLLLLIWISQQIRKVCTQLVKDWSRILKQVLSIVMNRFLLCPLTKMHKELFSFFLESNYYVYDCVSFMTNAMAIY